MFENLKIRSELLATKKDGTLYFGATNGCTGKYVVAKAFNACMDFIEAYMGGDPLSNAETALKDSLKTLYVEISDEEAAAMARRLFPVMVSFSATKKSFSVRKVGAFKTRIMNPSLWMGAEMPLLDREATEKGKRAPMTEEQKAAMARGRLEKMQAEAAGMTVEEWRAIYARIMAEAEKAKAEANAEADAE